VALSTFVPDLRLDWKRLIFGISKFVAEKRLSGSGGYWEVLDEWVDPTVIKQFNDDACAAACGEMLLIDRGCQMSQQEIARCAGGVPMEIAILAIALNQLANLAGRWIGAPIGTEGARSSMQGVRYKMTVDAFLDVWSRQAVYFVKL
jgi:hypothetical protein